jgi:hypothetical protein
VQADIVQFTRLIEQSHAGAHEACPNGIDGNQCEKTAATAGGSPLTFSIISCGLRNVSR